MKERQARKLAVILHADVVSSTALAQRDEALAHARIRDAFQRFSATIESYDGNPLELRGDALVAEFSRASDAVEASLAFQAENTRFNSTLEDTIQPILRIGISLGEVVVADNTVTGEGIVLAQRLEQLASGGGVCIQGAVYEAVPGRLPFDYEGLGEQELKGFTEPVRAYAVSLKSGETVPPPEDHAAPGKPRPEQPNQRWIVGAVVVLLVIVGGGLAWLQPWVPKEEPASIERMAFPLPDKPSIAVLPFDNLGNDPEQEYLSDGLTNDIITDLSKFNDLFVIASNSTFRYKNKPVKVQQVAEELGVRYVLEGSFQRVDQRLRINAQLIDATTGGHLWAERYDRDANDFFAIQEEILQTIVASLAFQVEAAEIKRALSKSTENLKAYDYYQRGRVALRQWNKEANNQALELIEKAIELDPEYARAYGVLTWIHANNSSGRYSWGENPDRSLRLVLEVARKSVELAPEDYYTHWALGFAHIIHGDFDRAEAAYQRALALNSNDDLLLATMVELLIKLGRAEQAIAQMKLAMRINPRHPEWYFWDLAWAQYIAGQYDEALASLKKMSNPPNGVRRILAAVLVRLGRVEEARAVMDKFIETDLDMTLEEMEGFAWKDREGLDRWIADLRTAGLPESRPLPLPDKPSIAVLPFTNMSGDIEQEYFVDGMTEDLITDLSKLSGLFVIARNSTFTYKGKAVKIRQVAEELGVRYVLEGSVRRVGDNVRINAQLIDATTGGHLWAERYDGSLTNVFELQDKVTQKIVSALAINLTTDEETRRMSKETDNPAAYDAFLAGWTRYRLFTPDDFAKAIPHFERAIQLDPNYGRAHAAIAAVYGEAYYNYWVRLMGVTAAGAMESTRRHLKAAMRNPTPLAHQIASLMFIFEGHYDDAIAEAERAVSLGPNDPSGYIAMARAFLLAGRPAESLEFINKAARLDPRSDFLYWLGAAQFHLERYEEAAATLARATEHNPGDLRSFLYLASAYGHLERQRDGDSAFETYKELRAMIPSLRSYRPTYTSEKLGIFLFKRQVETERLHSGLVKLGYESAPEIVEASPEEITIIKTTYTSVAQVYDAAREHCRKHGKKSNLMMSSPPSYVFGCQ